MFVETSDNKVWWLHGVYSSAELVITWKVGWKEGEDRLDVQEREKEL